GRLATWPKLATCSKLNTFWPRSDPPENLRGAPGPFFALLPGVSSWWPRMSAGRAILNGMERNGTLADGFENHLAAIALTLDDAGISRNASVSGVIGYLLRQASDDALPGWVRSTLEDAAAELETFDWASGEKRAEGAGE